MGKCLKVLLLIVVGLVGVSIYLCPCLLKEPKVPQVPSYKWWGPGPEPTGAANAKIESRPFRVQVQDEVLRDLNLRLQQTRLSPPLEGVAFEYGYNTDHLRSVLDYWQNKYDWRKEEVKLNVFPQFLAKIEGIDVHYIHVKPIGLDKKVKVFPLLMIHGWPGSVVEFYKIIPILTSGVTGIAFEVICPSIPGYGFSEAPHHPGYTAVDAARTFTKLMDSLGHRKFLVQGGDWGSAIATSISILSPDRVRGVHLNFVPFGLGSSGLMTVLKYVVGHIAPSLIFDGNKTYNIFPAKEYYSNIILESGYFHIQATKPDTVGVGLGDSPAGLAAYVLEKFSTATNLANREKKDGGLLEKFTMDELLTNIMVYWVTNTITSSVRFYKENMKPGCDALKMASIPVLVPSGIALFPHEISVVPRSMLSHKFPQLLTYSHMERGGHFAALEEPELLAEDIRKFVAAAEANRKEQAAKAKPNQEQTLKRSKKSAPKKPVEQAKPGKAEEKVKERPKSSESTKPVARESKTPSQAQSTSGTEAKTPEPIKQEKTQVKTETKPPAKPKDQAKKADTVPAKTQENLQVPSEQAKPEPVKVEQKPQIPSEQAKPEPVKVEQKPQIPSEQAKPEPVKVEQKPQTPSEQARPEPVKVEQKPQIPSEQAKPEPVKVEQKPQIPIEQAKPEHVKAEQKPQPEPVKVEQKPQIPSEQAKPEPVKVEQKPQIPSNKPDSIKVEEKPQVLDRKTLPESVESSPKQQTAKSEPAKQETRPNEGKAQPKQEL